MATYLLDTSVIIDVLNEKRNRSTLLQQLLSEGHLLACCGINVTETYAGMRPREEERTAILLKSLLYFPVTCSIARLAGLLKRDYAKKGRTLSVADATIAAVAMNHGLALVTDNAKDFPMQGLQLHPLP